VTGDQLYEALKITSNYELRKDVEKCSIGQLNTMLQACISNELYEKAAIIRDEIKTRG
jgi:protein-arginine kinase activator protein McsA